MEAVYKDIAWKICVSKGGVCTDMIPGTNYILIVGSYCKRKKWV